MDSKHELYNKLRTQFGIYLNVEEYESAFEESMKILEVMPLYEDGDFFHIFLHHIILQILQRLERLETLVKDLPL